MGEVVDCPFTMGGRADCVVCVVCERVKEEGARARSASQRATDSTSYELLRGI
jgi:hypothetical protein